MALVNGRHANRCAAAAKLKHWDILGCKEAYPRLPSGSTGRWREHKEVNPGCHKAAVVV